MESSLSQSSEDDEIDADVIGWWLLGLLHAALLEEDSEDIVDAYVVLDNATEIFVRTNSRKFKISIEETNEVHND